VRSGNQKPKIRKIELGICSDRFEDVRSCYSGEAQKFWLHIRAGLCCACRLQGVRFGTHARGRELAEKRVLGEQAEKVYSENKSKNWTCRCGFRLAQNARLPKQPVAGGRVQSRERKCKGKFLVYYAQEVEK